MNKNLFPIFKSEASFLFVADTFLIFSLEMYKFSCISTWVLISNFQIKLNEIIVIYKPLFQKKTSQNKKEGYNRF